MSMKPTSELFGEMFNRARQHWRHRAQQREEMPAPKPPAPAPTIAISRERGAGGSSIARLLGARLGWQVYDREILERLSEETHVRTELLESIDERQSNWLVDVMEAFSGDITAKGSYFEHLPKVLLSLAAHGECIVVGRGAAALLPPESTLRVRVVAAMKDRVARLEAADPQQKVKSSEIEKVDRQRNQFVKEFFHADATDPRGYDLVVNTSRFSDQQATELILLALKHRAGVQS